MAPARPDAAEPKACQQCARVAASRERIHARFRKVDKRGKCRCPYCKGDAEALAELAAEYELELYSAREKLEALAQVEARAQAAILQQAEQIAREVRAKWHFHAVAPSACAEIEKRIKELRESLSPEPPEAQP